MPCVGVKIEMLHSSRRLVQEVESNKDVTNNVNMETVARRMERLMEYAT